MLFSRPYWAYAALPKCSMIIRVVNRPSSPEAPITTTLATAVVPTLAQMLPRRRPAGRGACSGVSGLGHPNIHWSAASRPSTRRQSSRVRPGQGGRNGSLIAAASTSRPPRPGTTRWPWVGSQSARPGLSVVTTVQP